MGRKSNFSAEQKLKYVLSCIEGEDSINYTALLEGIGHTILMRWSDNYQSLGVDGLITTAKNSPSPTLLH